MQGGSTTHFDVIDAAGNALGCTHSLGSGFGSGVTVPGTVRKRCSGFCAILYCMLNNPGVFFKPSICQDRLGTNTGKVENETNVSVSVGRLAQ